MSLDSGFSDNLHLLVHFKSQGSAQNHIIVGLEGTFKGHLVQLPPKKSRNIFKLGQVAQSPVQPDLECGKRWGIYNLSGHLVVF